MTFKDLKLEPIPSAATEVKVSDDVVLSVTHQLTAQERENFIKFVIDNAMNLVTGTVNPFRMEIYCGLAIMKFYAGIEFTMDEIALEGIEIYETLSSTGVLQDVIDAIDESELDFIEDLLAKTADAVNEYNTSFVGMMERLNTDTSSLDSQLSEILSKIKDKEGIEFLSDIKQMGGLD